MSRFNQILFCCALVSLVVWYAYYKTEIEVIPSDHSLIIQEDESVEIDLNRINQNLQNSKFSIEVKTSPKNGTLRFSNNQFFYTPCQDFFGKDRFSYRYKYRNRYSNEGVILVDVLPRNDKPIAISKGYQLLEDHHLKVQLVGSDPDNDPLDFLIKTGPENGILKGLPPDLYYVPNPDYFGFEEIQFYVSDKKVDSEIASLRIEVLPQNDAPDVKDQVFETFLDQPLSFEIEASDPDNDTLTFQIISEPLYGKLVQKNQKMKYVPRKGFVGSDSIVVKICDDSSSCKLSNLGIITKPIEPENQLASVIKKVVKSGGIAIGNDLHPEYLHHSGKYIPASILKIITASAAIKALGSDHKFKTEIFYSGTDGLYIKGFGDPNFSAKDWHEIAARLEKLGVFNNEIVKLVIDPSIYSKRLKIDGRRQTTHYFDSPPSALATNQNKVTVYIKNGREVLVDDDYTPLTSMVTKKTKGMPKGRQYLSVASDSKESLQYSLEVADAIFEEYGAEFQEGYHLGKTPVELKPLLTYESQSSLRTSIKKMLKESSNYIANQLLLAIAYKERGEGVGIKDGVDIVKHYLEQDFEISSEHFEMVEGSGLSRKNKIDLLSMLKVLNSFMENRELLPPLQLSKYPELAKVGRKWKILAKSGTLKNVATLAGFIWVGDEEWKPFVIMLNDNNQKRSEVIDLIAQYLNG